MSSQQFTPQRLSYLFRAHSFGRRRRRPFSSRRFRVCRFSLFCPPTFRSRLEGNKRENWVGLRNENKYGTQKNLGEKSVGFLSDPKVRVFPERTARGRTLSLVSCDEVAKRMSVANVKKKCWRATASVGR